MGLLRKLTTKLKPTLRTKTIAPSVTSPPLSPSAQSPTGRSGVPVAPKDHVAIQRRQAALQQCGLVPVPRKDLSQLEKELDRKFSHVVVVPQDQPDQGELSTAERIRREWQAKNETQPVQQGDVGPKDPSNDTFGPTEEQKAPKAPTPASLQTVFRPSSPASLGSIQRALLFSDIPEEDHTPSETEKVRLILVQLLPPADSQIVKPLPSAPSKGTVGVPLPDSSSPTGLSEISPVPSPRDSKRLPPIDVNLTTNNAEKITEEASRSRLPNRQSINSLTTKSSLPALSPTMTASSYSTIPTPVDDESRERMGAMITGSGSIKSRSSHRRKASDSGRDSEDLGIVHETIPESPELTTTGSRSSNPARENTATVGPTSFEAFVEKRARRTMSIGVFQSNKRSSGSCSTKSVSSEQASRWGGIANDFSLKPLDTPRSSSISPVSVTLSVPVPLFLIPLPFQSTPALAAGNERLTPTQSQPAIQQPRYKFTRSRSVISSLGLKMTRKTAPRPAVSSLPPSPPLPERRATVKIIEGREGLMQNVRGIEDDESRRLTELAFVDY